MTKQTLIKYIFLFFILLPFVLNIFWSGTGPGWLYWAARFLSGIEQVVGGILLLIFPMAIQRLFGKKADRRIAGLLIIFGIYLLIIGFDLLSLMSRQWMTECGNIAGCLK